MASYCPPTGVCRFHRGQPDNVAKTTSQTVSERPAAADRAPGERLYRAFVEFSTEGIWRFVMNAPLSVDLPVREQVDHLLGHARLAECNAAMARLIGADDPSQLLGMTLSEFLSVDSESDREYLSNFVTSGYRLAAEEYRRRDEMGRLRFFVIGFSGEVRDGHLVGAWGTMQDITRLKEVESALRASEARYRILAESSPLGIWHLDRDGRTIYANPAMCELLGVESLEKLGDAHFSRFFDEDSLAVIAREDRKRATGKSSNYEVTLRSAADEPRQVLVAGAPVMDAAGELVGLIGTFVDLTERKRAESRLRETEGRFRLVAEQTGELLYDYELSSGHINWVGATRAITGYAPDELAEFDIERWESHLHPRDRDAVLAHLENARAERGQFHIEYRFRTREGDYHDIEDRGAFLLDAGGEPVRMLGTMSDVTERKRIERRLRLTANALEHMAEGLVIQDADLKIVQVNRSFTSITGYRAEEVLGTSMSLLYSPRHDERFKERVRAVVRKRGHWRGEVWHRRKSGESYPVLLSLSAVYDDHGQLTHYISVFSDISQYKHYEERLTFLAHHDPLTGLPNRTMFEERVQQAINDAQRAGTQFAVLFVDLDHFKTINDSLGHAVGDDLLKQVAARLRRWVRESDTVARQGGDEFTILLSEIREPENACVVAHKILDAMTAPFTESGSELFSAASIGISCYPTSGRDVATLMKSADAAMYEAKKAGRNTYKLFSSDMNAEALQNLVMANSLRQALERDQFMLYYQPFVNLESGEVTGVEALLRWKHPELGFTEPGRFIGLAEETGVIDRIGEWVLDTACEQMKTWRTEGRDPGRVAVNLSARQFDQSNLLKQILRALERSGLAPGQLTLEITESMLMQNPARTGRMLSRLSDIGVGIAIDDFGTGYSSLGYLKHFPIDCLKIDKSFVQGLPRDQDDAAITRTIIAMASSLGIKVIAEGVETEAQRRFLMEEGCRQGQGFLFVKPLAPQSLTPVLRRVARN